MKGVSLVNKKEDNGLDVVLSEYKIDCYGVVPFAEFRDQLILCRAKSLVPNGAKNVIVIALPYSVGDTGYMHRNVARYAMLPDYHVVLGEMLRNIAQRLEGYYGGEWACFADNSPIPEVLACEKACIGVRGDNNLIITKKYGSYVFVGEIVTTVSFDIQYVEPKFGQCLKCGKCKANCPTGAICEGSIDYARCLSHITQQKRELTLQEEDFISKSGIAWGCDICQQVCPLNMNDGIEKTFVSAFLEDIVPVVTPQNIPDLVKTRAFGYRGEKVISRNVELVNRGKL